MPINANGPGANRAAADSSHDGDGSQLSTGSDAAEVLDGENGQHPLRPLAGALAPAIVATTGFDYGGLSTNTANYARKVAGRIRSRINDSYIETGRDLKSAKIALGHGYFGEWIAAEFGWTDRTANNLMAAAKLAEGKSEKFANLPVSAVYAPAAPSTPEATRTEILARVEGGEVLSVKEIASTIADAKRREADERQEQARLAG